MAIQFQCAGCSHPIEVDDQYAGQSATCPYCRRVIVVPTQSTYQPGAAAVARPAIAQPRSFDEQRAASARSFGTWALACSVLSVVLFLGIVGYVVARVGRYINEHGSAPQTAPEMERVFEADPNMGWLGLAGLALVAFAVVGLALAITSVVKRGSGNWRGWLSLLICAGFVLLIGANVVIRMSGVGA